MKPSSKRARRAKADLRHPKRVVPYDTGKVKIGLLYTPPMPSMDADAEKIQANLMGWPLSFERRIADWLNRSPWSLAGAVLLILVAISFMKGCTR